ncbi:hypothetical protein PIB30_099660, partial [Stylosanthes scabra]|nr:hypothetical protein [Stylosanthes scabra]
MGQIPTQISYLTKLETLDLSTTFTSSSQHGLKLEKPNIVVSSKLYKNERTLSRWCCNSNQRKGVVPCCFFPTKSLSGPLDPSLTKLHSLKVLQLSHNNLSSPVPEYLVNLSSLNTLQLRNCGLSGVFPKAIFQLPSLEVLDVS